MPPQQLKTTHSSWRISNILVGLWSRFYEIYSKEVIWLRSRWPLLWHRLAIAGTGTTVLAASVMAGAFFWPRDIAYSLADTNCVYNPVILPGLVGSSGTKNYSTELKTSLDIWGYPIFSGETCFTKEKIAEAGSTHILELSYAFLPVGKNITLTSPELPQVLPSRPQDMPVATSGGLAFRLSTEDRTFSYKLSANNLETMCSSTDGAIWCNLDQLNLKQGKVYDFRVHRLFSGDTIGLVFQTELPTVDPIRITGSSINSGQLVQEVPSAITLTVNKPIKQFGGFELYLINDGQKTPVETTSRYENNQLTLTFAAPLKRNAKFELVLQELTAGDGAYLAKPYVLGFSTSGGPKVLSANIGNYGVNTWQSIRLNLDAEPKPGQTLSDFINLSGSGFIYDLSQQGQEIIISPRGSWPKCARFSISFKDGLQNIYGVSGGSAWEIKSRTICRSISTIGSSVENRPIYSASFGNGADKILFVGGTHGDEPSSVYILNSLIDHLEANYDVIPANKTIVVVSNINPDGLVQGQRTNSNNIDLNRNFPAINWKQDVIMPGGWLNKGGGGNNPLSEPESSAIASYTLALNPKLVLTYHAVGGMVIANGSGASSALADNYGLQTGYRTVDNGVLDSVFSHDITGAYEDWLHDRRNIPALLIELNTYTGNEFWRHQNAMWSMIRS